MQSIFTLQPVIQTHRVGKFCKVSDIVIIHKERERRRGAGLRNYGTQIVFLEKLVADFWTEELSGTKYMTATIEKKQKVLVAS